ncbi:autotransporter domain-containing protein [Rhodoblastus acidophilus]|uniref:Autotransporter domain-containing protein n=1 Tax=Rhodoblastus acidophilus TaxID=1074 RepID=A0A6N8DJY7_RHOAC|nr:autotransporter domain-containing protein [Rhodoblastus acidophilus]MCW2272918.1 phospholipase/lecithinase/hemolysin/uncharacterized protein YhjY with autotransporter beta-barrel domain [Rhodoblastus acidophilus]MTV29825.1 autotransporter domain-containing protein [Rhodoblastus acidophilus]
MVAKITNLNPRRRTRALVAALVAGVAPLSAAHAQHYSSIVAFGDSYADIGNIQKIMATTPGFGPTLAAINFIYPTGRFSGGTNYVDSLSSIYRIPQSNYALGGAQTGTGNDFVGLPGFAQEWQGFVGAGGKIAPNQLVTLDIGGNDARDYYQSGGSMAGVPAAAATSVTQAMAGVKALTAVGAKTLVFAALDVSQLPEAAKYSPSAVAVGAAYSQTFNAAMQQNLAAVAASGVRVEYLDGTRLLAEITANPAAYGLQSAGACPTTCLGNSALQAQYLFYLDQLHLTSAGFAIVADYIANRLNAPQTLAATASSGVGVTNAFVSTLFGRLDLFNGGAAPSASRELASTKGPPGVEPSPWSAFMQVDGAVATRGNAGDSLGYNWYGVGGSFGVEYRLAPDAMIGAAYHFSSPSVQLNQNGGKFDGVANQLGVYGAYDLRNLFFQGLLSYGWVNYDNTRPGVIDSITSHPSGTTFAAAFKSGYLFDVAPSMRLGPIAGLTYARADFNGYTESGDPVLTLNVKAQNAEALLGSAGLQARGAFAWNRTAIDAYFNATAEDYFNGVNRLIQYSAVSAPLIVNTWTAAGAPNHAFARLSTGASARVTGDVALTINLSQTLGQPGGDGFVGSGGIKIAF